jgi:hypothetical protein
MSAAVVDITIDQNATFLMRVTLTDISVDPNVPVDLADCTIASQIRQYPHRGVVATFTPDITDAVNGKFSLSLTATETASLPVVGLKYDVVVTYPAGVSKKRVIQGNIKVSEPITI